jgi:TfoX/Sxy family transcriptional regulator of competence genes
VAFDEKVAARVRAALAGMKAVEEKKMFGGLAFMVRGHMSIGILNEELMVRIGPDAHASALTERHVRMMDFTGRSLTGYVFVGPKGFATPEALEAWVERALEFNRTLKAK